MIPTHDFITGRPNKTLLFFTAVMAVVYFVFLAFFLHKGNPILFYALVAGEVFHLWQILTYLFTAWEPEFSAVFDATIQPPVDVFITVAGEPVGIVEETAVAALRMDYPNFKVHLLNDGYVAKKDNWKDMEVLAKRLGIKCITRKIPGGAKAGNINNALKITKDSLVAVFDADHVPHADFLQKTVPYFADAKMGFVQSPQFYKNALLNQVTAGAWEQQELFFGPVCRGKNRLNSTFLCGSNMILRREALMAAGGMCETNIAEDFMTSLFIHEQGWKSVYVDEVLAEGLAPEDFLSYYKQQFRWARGSLEMVFKYNPLFRKNLSWAQKIQYLSSSSFYLSGIVVLIDALLPLLFFFTGQVPLVVSTMSLAAIFMPYMFLVIMSLQSTSNNSLTFRAVAFSMSSWTIHLRALWAVLLNQKNGFSVTSKTKVNGNFAYLTSFHILYLLLVAAGVFVCIIREGLSAAFLSNFSWALFNSAVFSYFIVASLPETQKNPALANQTNSLKVLSYEAVSK